MDAIKDKAVACDDIRWNPEWGKERMIAMIRERSDWCISASATGACRFPWLYCEECEKPVCTPETIDVVANLFAQHGQRVV